MPIYRSSLPNAAGMWNPTMPIIGSGAERTAFAPAPMALSRVAPTRDVKGRSAGGDEATGQLMTSSTGRWLALLAAFLGWLFDGFEMGIFGVVGKAALGSML